MKEWPGYIMQMNGPANVPDDVKLVQGKLGVWETGTYGQTTAENVSKYQKANGIGVTAEVGEQTWNSLFAVAPPPPATGQMGPAAQSWARGEVGVREVPIGSNWGVRVSEYLASVGITSPAYWCAAFVYWCFEQQAKGAGVPNPLVKSASCSQIYAWAKENGKLVYSPQCGDIFLCIGGDTGHYHTGFVAQNPDSSNKFQTIEGNSNQDGSSNGYEVAFRKPGRAVSSCDYVRL